MSVTTGRGTGEQIVASVVALAVAALTLTGVTLVLVALPAFTHPATNLGEQWQVADRGIRITPAGLPGWEQAIWQRTWHTDVPTEEILETLDDVLSDGDWGASRLNPRGGAGIGTLDGSWELWRWADGNQLVLDQRDPPTRTLIRIDLSEATAVIDVHITADRR